jgi:hypothetical protein
MMGQFCCDPELRLNVVSKCLHSFYIVGLLSMSKMRKPSCKG